MYIDRYKHKRTKAELKSQQQQQQQQQIIPTWHIQEHQVLPSRMAGFQTEAGL